MFIIGLICGVLLAILNVLVLLLIKARYETQIETVLAKAESLVKEKKLGAIYEAPLDIDLARQEIIDTNLAEGKETKISALIDDDYA